MRMPRNHRITVAVEEDLKSDLESLADDGNRSVSDFIRLVLREYCTAVKAGEEVVVDDEM